MSPITDAKRFAERLLTQVSPDLPTSYEGVAFTSPGGMHQRTQFIINPPEDPTFPAGYHRENVQFQVFVVGVLGEGTAAVIERAELIRKKFYKGYTWTEQGRTPIHILTTPQISGILPINDRAICPVLIDLVVEVYQ